MLRNIHRYHIHKMGILIFLIIEMAIHMHDLCHARSEVLVLDDIKDLPSLSSSILQSWRFS